MANEETKVKYIPLTQNQFAIVDDGDFEWLSKHKWFADWIKSTKSYYAYRRSKIINGKRHSISMAREILGLKKGDKLQPDHINHNTLDNRRYNLRIVTHQQNHWNQKKPKGCYWHKRAKKWQAQIVLKNKKIYLGCFETEQEAHVAYLEAKKIYHKIHLRGHL